MLLFNRTASIIASSSFCDHCAASIKPNKLTSLNESTQALKQNKCELWNKCNEINSKYIMNYNKKKNVKKHSVLRYIIYFFLSDLGCFHVKCTLILNVLTLITKICKKINSQIQITKTTKYLYATRGEVLRTRISFLVLFFFNWAFCFFILNGAA